MRQLLGFSLLLCAGGVAHSFSVVDPPATPPTPPAALPAPASATPASANPALTSQASVAPALAVPAPGAPGVDEPTVESTASQPAAVATELPTANAPANASGAAVDTAAAKAAAAAAAEDKKYRSMGYRPHVRHGETDTVWCKSEVRVGSRIPVTTCATVAQLQEIAREAEDTANTIMFKNQMQPQQPCAAILGVCGGTGGH